jgi:site-specific recombinase
MNKQPNTLVVRHKHLKINIGIDPETNRRLTELTDLLIEAGMKKPSTSLMVRYALRELALRFEQHPLDHHTSQLKSLA